MAGRRSFLEQLGIENQKEARKSQTTPTFDFSTPKVKLKGDLSAEELKQFKSEIMTSLTTCHALIKTLKREYSSQQHAPMELFEAWIKKNEKNIRSFKDLARLGAKLKNDVNDQVRKELQEDKEIGNAVKNFGMAMRIFDNNLYQKDSNEKTLYGGVFCLKFPWEDITHSYYVLEKTLNPNRDESLRAGAGR